MSARFLTISVIPTCILTQRQYRISFWEQSLSDCIVGVIPTAWTALITSQKFHGVYANCPRQILCVFWARGVVLPVKALHNVFIGEVAQKDKRSHCRTSPIPSRCSAQSAAGQRPLKPSRHWICSVLSFTRATLATQNQNLKRFHFFWICFMPVIRQSFNRKRKHS